MISPIDLMTQAVAVAQQGITRGQTPFGCAIARGDNILSVHHNRVWQTTDITAHAEIVALRAACQVTGQIHLAGCVVATTCEPCPMCMAALHWARVEKVYYGATIEDAAAAGFNELPIRGADLLRQGKSSVQLLEGPLRDDCRALFRLWQAGQGQSY